MSQHQTEGLNLNLNSKYEPLLGAITSKSTEMGMTVNTPDVAARPPKLINQGSAKTLATVQHDTSAKSRKRSTSAQTRRKSVGGTTAKTYCTDRKPTVKSIKEQINTVDEFVGGLSAMVKQDHDDNKNSIVKLKKQTKSLNHQVQLLKEGLNQLSDVVVSEFEAVR